MAAEPGGGKPAGLRVRIEEGCAKFGSVLDTALDKMDAGLDKGVEQVGEDTCCGKCLKNFSDFEDPVQMARCSAGRMGFFLLTVFCSVVAVVDWIESDWWNWMSALFVALLGLYAAVFLGGDIFMFDAFRQVINKIQGQIEKFTRANEVYERELDKLSSVADGLEAVKTQMGGDLQATTDLLVDMERFSKLQTASTLMGQFFAADYDQSGQISGQEADLLVPQLTILWEMVPTFDQERFTQHVRENGLTLPQFSGLLDALVADDPRLCLKALEELCGLEDSDASPAAASTASTNGESTPAARTTRGIRIAGANSDSDSGSDNNGGAGGMCRALCGRDEEASHEHQPLLREDGNHCCMPPVGVETPWPLTTTDTIVRPVARPAAELGAERREFDIEAQCYVKPRFSAEAVHAMAPVESSEEDEEELSDEESDEEVLQPMCTINTPTFNVGPLPFGGPVSIWGVMHLAFVIATVFALLFAVVVILGMELDNIMIAIVGVCLSLGLAGAGRLLEVLRVLRQQVKELRTENDRLAKNNDDLGKQVLKLKKLKVGIDKLQTMCEGNVDKARELIESSNTKVKMQAMSVVTNLFKAADRDRDMQIDEDEVDDFMNKLEDAFGSLPGFDRDELQENLVHEGLTTKEMNRIVDAIVAFSEQPE